MTNTRYALALATLLFVSGLAQASNGYSPKRPSEEPANKTPAAAVQSTATANAMATLGQQLISPARSSNQVLAPAGRTRAEVLEELRQAEADGSIRRIRTNRGF